MPCNTHNSNRPANNDADNNNKEGEGVEADNGDNTNTFPQSVPAPNIQGTAATGKGTVSQHEFNLSRNRINNVEATLNDLNTTVSGLNNSIVDAISQ